jgi:hypothetical protein
LIIVLTSATATLAQTPNPGAWTATPLDTFSTLWEKTLMATNAATGAVTQRTVHYTELGNGLNFVGPGDALERSVSAIELAPDTGGAIAPRGALMAAFKADISATNAVSFSTSSGNVFRSHPIGLFYFDSASGKLATLGLVQRSAGVLHPPNIIVYSNMLSGLDADLVVVWTKGGYEQSLVLNQAPPPPESLGLSSGTCRLQFWTALDQWPEPAEQRAVTLSSGLVDHIFVYPDCWFPVGAAFTAGGLPLPPAGQPARIRLPRPADTNTLCVAKSLLSVAGQKVLVEEVRLQDIWPALTALPHTASSPRERRGVELAAFGGVLQPQAPPESGHLSIRVASAPYRSSGVALDYITYSGGGYGYTFSPGTYYIPDSASVGPGGAIFESGACLKFGLDASLILDDGPVTFPASGADVVFTSKDDDMFGDAIQGSTGNPSHDADPAIWMYYHTTSSVIQHAQFRWAQAAIEYDENQGVSVNPSISATTLQNCAVGLEVNMVSDALYLSQASYCNVGAPWEIWSVGRIFGSLTANCGVVNASRWPGDQAEPAIVVREVSPGQKRIVIVSMDPTFNPGNKLLRMISNDNGATWSQTDIADGVFKEADGQTIMAQACCDPSMAYDAYGNLFLTYIATAPQGAQIVLYVSTDNGGSFSRVSSFSITPMGTGLDLPRVATGPSGTGSGQAVWVSMYDVTDYGGAAAMGTLVTGLGVGAIDPNWTANPLPSGSGCPYTGIAVGPNGQVLVSCVQLVQNFNPWPPTTVHTAIDPDGLGPAQFQALSTTFSLSFGAESIKPDCSLYDEIDGPPPTPGGIAALPIPTLAWDRVHNRAYIVYHDRPALCSPNPPDLNPPTPVTEPCYSDTDIYLRWIQSPTQSSGWSDRIRVNDDPLNSGASQFHPRIAVDEGTGNVAVSWYDCREDPSNETADYWAAVSRDEFQTPPANFRLTWLPSNARGLGYGYYDYTGLAYYEGWLYPVWQDNSDSTEDNPDGSNNALDIYVAKIPY